MDLGDTANLKRIQQLGTWLETMQTAGKPSNLICSVQAQKSNAQCFENVLQEDQVYPLSPKEEMVSY